MTEPVLTGAWAREGGKPILDHVDVLLDIPASLVHRSAGGEVTGEGAVLVARQAYGSVLRWTISGGLLRRGSESVITLGQAILDRIVHEPGARNQAGHVVVSTLKEALAIRTAFSSELVSALETAIKQPPPGDPIREEYQRIMAPGADTDQPESGAESGRNLTYDGVTDLIGQRWLVEVIDDTIVRALDLSQWGEEDLERITTGGRLNPNKCREVMDEQLETQDEIDDGLRTLRVSEEGLPYDVLAPDY